MLKFSEVQSTNAQVSSHVRVWSTLAFMWSWPFHARHAVSSEASFHSHASRWLSKIASGHWHHLASCHWIPGPGFDVYISLPSLLGFESLPNA